MTNANLSPNTPPEAVDRLLGDYFKAQMPARWPAAPRPGTKQTARSAPAVDTLTPARWALAASVALLIGGGWVVSHFTDNGKPRNATNFDGGTADLKHMKDLSKKTK